MSARVSVVVASRNLGKLRELRALLAPLELEIWSLDEAGAPDLVVVEDGATFEENAEKKAREAARATGMIALADDSGLEVDALGGRPGVRSARFAHEHATDAENNTALLEALGGTPDAERSARFRCVLCVVDPRRPAAATFVRGACEGHIARASAGHDGFGYDPLFVVDEPGRPEGAAPRTMAELTEQEKNRISHRGVAFRAIFGVLQELSQ